MSYSPMIVIFARLLHWYFVFLLKTTHLGNNTNTKSYRDANCRNHLSSYVSNWLNIFQQDVDIFRKSCWKKRWRSFNIRWFKKPM